jgi:hypothetical protein
MVNVNQCDLNCPLTTLRGAEYALFSEGEHPGKKLELATTVGILGVAQMARSAFFCPRRRLGPEEWTPSERCAGATRDVLDGLDLPLEEVEARLSEHQFSVLRPYLGPPPEEATPPPQA